MSLTAFRWGPICSLSALEHTCPIDKWQGRGPVTWLRNDCSKTGQTRGAADGPPVQGATETSSRADRSALPLVSGSR